MDMVKLGIFECSIEGFFSISRKFEEKKYLNLAASAPNMGWVNLPTLGLLPRDTLSRLTILTKYAKNVYPNLENIKL